MKFLNFCKKRPTLDEGDNEEYYGLIKVEPNPEDPYYPIDCTYLRTPYTIQCEEKIRSLTNNHMTRRLYRHEFFHFFPKPILPSAPVLETPEVPEEIIQSEDIIVNEGMTSLVKRLMSNFQYDSGKITKKILLPTPNTELVGNAKEDPGEVNEEEFFEDLQELMQQADDNIFD